MCWLRGVDWKKVREWTDALLVASIIAGIMFFVCWPLQIDGISMENTLHSNDRVFMSRVWTYVMPISHGDIVLCNIVDKNDSKNIIKRVIGLPDDHIVISGGEVYINDLKLDEPYLQGGYTSGDIDLVLNKDEYFVMGDNRWVSNDSRMLGSVGSDKIIGKVFFRFYPFSKIGVF